MAIFSQSVHHTHIESTNLRGRGFFTWTNMKYWPTKQKRLAQQSKMYSSLNKPSWIRDRLIACLFPTSSWSDLSRKPGGWSMLRWTVEFFVVLPPPSPSPTWSRIFILKLWLGSHYRTFVVCNSNFRGQSGLQNTTPKNVAKKTVLFLVHFAPRGATRADSVSEAVF